MCEAPRARRARAATCAALLTLCVACHTPLLRTTPESALASADRHHLIGGIRVPPAHGHEGCAAAAVAAVLASRQPALDPAALARDLPWHETGASPVDLLLEIRRRGFQARLERGTAQRLEELAQRGEPALVLIDAGPELQTLTRSVPLVRGMHWAVASGVARDGSTVLLAAAGRRHHVVAREEFLRRWDASDRCMILVEGGPAEGAAEQ
jgi:ABC-type bacteriocin/lantibiotic exporter with double-glycine peptidase domain